MIRRGYEPVAGVLFLLVGVIAYVILGGGPQIEDSVLFWLVFAGLTLLAIPIGYWGGRFFYLVGLAPSGGLVISLFVDGGHGGLWPIAIVFWALLLLPAFGLSWAGHGLRVRKRRDAKHQFVLVLITVVNAITFLIYTVPLVFLGVLGVGGHLADTHDDPTMGWVLLAAAALGLIFHAVSTFCIVSAARRARRLQGHCPMCKYDLREEMEQGCSECGWNRDP